MEAEEITLPGGSPGEDGWHRTAALRPLCGRDEAFLGEEGAALAPAARTTALLVRCLQRLGPLAPVTPAAVRALTVGDREALLLHLRRLTLGERIDCVLACPEPACGRKMDLELSVRDLLLPPYDHAAAVHERRVEEAGECYRVRFRLVNGGDQEAAAALAMADPTAAAERMLEWCVQEVVKEGEREESVSSLPPAVVRALPPIMASLDPQAEILLNVTCPDCGAGFAVLFDTADYVFRELAGQSGDLYQEVHLLASHYHWSEEEIMGMTRRKRRRYLELLAGALTGSGRE